MLPLWAVADDRQRLAGAQPHRLDKEVDSL
jgi:hypothetical protein